MKNKENFPKAKNEQIVNKDGYSKYPLSDDTYNKFDQEFDIDSEETSKIKSNQTVEEDSEWKEMNFDLAQCGDDCDDFNFEFDDQQENSSSVDE
jgi:hypothetical protein